MNPVMQKLLEQANHAWKTLEPLLQLKDQKILEQLKGMGLATREEVQALEERVAALERKLAEHEHKP